jgi:type III pantothenate kinase
MLFRGQIGCRGVASAEMATAEFLLIDNSNSFTKFALSSREALSTTRRVRTAELNAATLRTILRGWRFARCVICSVVPEKAAIFKKTFAGLELHEVSWRSKLGVGIDYPKPRSIGADRLANAASAFAFYGSPCVVVDFGTAVTFDILGPGNGYIGGVIAPGLEAMTDYLHQRTALLPKISLLEPPSAIGKSTTHAMLAGAVYGYRGLVREILRKIREDLGQKRLKVVATGGYASLIATGVREISAVHDHLTLEGLRLIGGLNFP